MKFHTTALVWIALSTTHHSMIAQAFKGVSSSPRSLFLSSTSRSTTTTTVGWTRQHRPLLSRSGPLYADTQSTAPATVTRLENSAVMVDIVVPGTATQAAYDKVCTDLSKQITIPGFRKGSRIPPAVLEQNMAAKGGRNALKVQAIQELVGQLVEPALKQQALDPIGQPVLKVPAEELATTFVAGQPLTLQVQCDVWPDIQWKTADRADSKPYLGLRGKYARRPFNQEKLNVALRDLQERYASLEPIADATHALQMGDACTVNMNGYLAADGAAGSTVKGEPLPNAASGDRVEVILGTGRYMEGLVEGLVGAKVGDTVTIAVNFPEKLRDKTLAGKKAIFDVEVLEASQRTVPEITDEFAAKVRPGLTKEALLAQLTKAIDEEDAKEFVPARNSALGKALAQVMDVDVPDTLVTNQAREKFAMMMSEMRDGGVSDEEIKRQINPENFLKYKAIVKDDIIRDFKISMATDEIARLEGIDVPDYDVEEQMEAIRKDAGESEEFDENMIRAKVRTTLQRQAVMDWLAERAELEVEYTKDGVQVDEKLLEELAEQSMKREAEALQVDPAVVEAIAVVEDTAVVAKETSSASAPPTPAAEQDDAELSLEEKAFRALVASGAVQINKSPDDPDYDHSADDEVAPSVVKK